MNSSLWWTFGQTNLILKYLGHLAERALATFTFSNYTLQERFKKFRNNGSIKI